MAEHGFDGYFAVEDSAGTTLRDISGDLNSVNFNRSNEMHDPTTFGNTARRKRAGLMDGSISISGFYSTTALTGTDTVLKGLLGLATPVGFEYGAVGNTTGMAKKSGNCVLESYNVSTPVGDLVSFDATFQIDGPVVDGTFA